MRFAIDGKGVGEPPFVLLHGLASTRRIFDLLVPHLASNNKVITYDQRGHGESDKPDDGYTVARFAADLDDVLRREGVSRPVLVGHSFGAHVARHHAVTRRTARGLVLVDGGVVEMHEHLSWDDAATQLAPPPDDQKEIERFIHEGPGGFTVPELVDVRRSIFERAPGGTWRKRLTAQRHLALLRSSWEQDVHDELSRLGCPTLVLLCRLARERAPEGRWLAQKERAATRIARLPHVSVRWFEDTAHDVPVHRPRELAQAILSFMREAL